MEEVELSFDGQRGKLFTEEMVDKAYFIITMGCFDKCLHAPLEKTWDWMTFTTTRLRSTVR